MNPFASLKRRHRKGTAAEALYGAIVAQARLPLFYQAFGVPDTLAGRFQILVLHLFAVLHRLRAGNPDAAHLAQELTDTFTRDMETVLRETGVGDLSIPKRVRAVAGSSAALLQGYETALAKGDAEFAAAIAKSLPLEGNAAEDAAQRLTHYLKDVVRHLGAQRVAALAAGELTFPDVSKAF